MNTKLLKILVGCGPYVFQGKQFIFHDNIIILLDTLKKLQDEKEVNIMKQGVGVIIFSGNNVLLGKRLSKHGEETWGFPGGHLEEDETIESCATRAVEEETGLKLLQLYPAPSVCDYFPEKNVEYTTTFVIAPYPGGLPEVKEKDKCAEWQWFDWSNLPEHLFKPIKTLIASGFNLKTLNKKKQIIEVFPYDPTWIKQFEEEAEKIKSIFADNCIAVHHIGSTSIPGLAAKPTIDILLEVICIEQIDQYNNEMARLGYEAWGEYGIPGRRFFLKGEDKRTHHVHTFQQGHAGVNSHLYFRDYLKTHPVVAKEYAQLKTRLAQEFKHDRRKYVENKESFVKAIEKAAIDWFNKK